MHVCAKCNKIILLKYNQKILYQKYNYALNGWSHIVSLTGLYGKQFQDRRRKS